MTDNEVIMALECCAYWENDKSCEDCPANTYDFSCANRMAKYALNFINRQTAEIDELKRKFDDEKSEAIKKFAERLKNVTFLGKEKKSVEHTVWIYEIDNLVKEMTEVQN